MIQVFIGYDPREAIAFSVLAYSIQARSSVPVAITPIMLSQLKGVLTRERHPLQSTDFSFSRFLTPYLSGFTGWSIFMDGDMLVLDDIAKLHALRDDRYAVMVVKHEHIARESRKFLNEPQTAYQKKNWSSLMMFNNARCRALTTDYVNAASGLDLHQFKWLGDDALIGEIPDRWNHLVGCHPPRKDVSLIHHTLGGPYFNECHNAEYGDEWRLEFKAMCRVDQREKS